MKMTSGTYLFPVLGSGVDYTTYGLFHLMARFSTHRAFVKIFLQAFALCILIGVQIAVGAKNENFRISLLVLATSAIAITAFNYRSGGDFIWRYNFPQFLCAIVVFYAATGSSLLLEPSHQKLGWPFILAWYLSPAWCFITMLLEATLDHFDKSAWNIKIMWRLCGQASAVFP